MHRLGKHDLVFWYDLVVCWKLSCQPSPFYRFFSPSDTRCGEGLASLIGHHASCIL